MAKGESPYFNPEQPLVAGQLLNPVFWVKFFENLTAEANAVINLDTDVIGRLLLSNFATGPANTVLHGNGAGVDSSFAQVDLANDVTGRLLFANLTAATTDSVLLGRRSSSAGNFEEITLGSGITMSGTTLSATGSGGTVTGPGTSVNNELVLFSGTSGEVIKRATGTGVVHATSGVYSVADVDLTTEVTGVLPIANGGSLSGTWTPTLTNTTNIDASTPFLSQYSRAGNVVTFSGRVDIDPTAAASTVLGVSLPVASNFANNFEAGGTFVNPAVASECGAILADATNDRLTFQFIALSTSNQSFFFSGSYLVI